MFIRHVYTLKIITHDTIEEIFKSVVNIYENLYKKMKETDLVLIM